MRSNDGVHRGLCKVLGQLAFHAAHKFFGQGGVSCFVGGKRFVPLGFACSTTLLGIPVGVHIFRNDERLVGPAQCFACEFDFFGAQRFAMCFGRVGTVGATFADSRFANNECGFVWAVLGICNGFGHSRSIVAINSIDHVPTVSGKTLRRVVNEPWGHLTVNGNAVVVVHGNQLVELPSASQCACFVADAFHQAAIAHEHVSMVINDVVSSLIEFCGQ